MKGRYRITCKGYEEEMCKIKRGLRNSILPTLMYGSETWTWNRAQQSGVHDVKMSYLRGACGVTRWKDETNESVYEKCV